MTTPEVGVDVLCKRFTLLSSKTVQRAKGRRLSLLELYLNVIRAMRWKLVKLRGSKDSVSPGHVLGGNKVSDVIVGMIGIGDWGGGWGSGFGSVIQVIGERCGGRPDIGRRSNWRKTEEADRLGRSTSGFRELLWTDSPNVRSGRGSERGRGATKAIPAHKRGEVGVSRWRFRCGILSLLVGNTIRGS